MYKVGLLTRPAESDERYDELEDAEEMAMKNSIDDDVWGVWDAESGTLISIAYQRQIFTS